MKSQIVSSLLLCLLVPDKIFGHGFRAYEALKSCSTRDEVSGKCLYPGFCPEYWKVLDKKRSFFHDKKACGHRMVCCPMRSVNALPIPQSEPTETELNKHQGDKTKNDAAVNTGTFPLWESTRAPRKNLKDSETNRQYPVFSGSKAFNGTSEFNTEQELTTDIDTTQGLKSTVGLNRTQLIFPSNCLSKVQGERIFGGDDTKMGEFPWMALLEFDFWNDTRLLCGGSLITNWHVLTAAHCVYEPELKQRGITLRSVRLGEWDITSDPDCVTESALPRTNQKPRCAPKFLNVPIQKVYIHPSYKPWPIAEAGDIALLQLQEPVQFNEYVRPICLPESGKIPSRNTVAGWGRTENLLPSHRLLKVDLPLADRQECESDYWRKNVTLKSSQLCFGELGKDTCGGDSGGPLMQIDDFGINQLSIQIIGIVSLGPANCGATTTAGLYTKVYDYVPWIQGQIRLLNEPERELTPRFKKSQAPELDGSDKIIFRGY